jgi:hypothetical protein
MRVIHYRETTALHKRHEEENIKNEMKVIKGMIID